MESAPQRLDDMRSDVAVLDGSLRGRPVAPVAQRLRSPEISFLLSSAYDIFTSKGREALVRAENVQKPVSVRGLIEALRRVLL